MRLEQSSNLTFNTSYKYYIDIDTIISLDEIIIKAKQYLCETLILYNTSLEIIEKILDNTWRIDVSTFEDIIDHPDDTIRICS
ncbi:Hypothetical protein HVR_LOCUS182 [uncultured virus]|nr:Hypothetical protein HVR_LOCUS182 [uncultured virus]